MGGHPHHAAEGNSEQQFACSAAGTASRQEMAQRKPVELLDIGSARDEEHEHVRKDLPDELTRADELHRYIHIFARRRFTLAFRRDNLGFQGIVDRQTLRHPTKLFRPSHVPHFVKEDVPTAGYEEHVEWDVNVKLRDTAKLAEVQSEGN